MKKSEKQIIFIELNEVPSIVFKRYAKESKNFSKLLNKFSKYETKSFDKVHLSPWITWPTVHRGVTYKYHKIENLGQDITEANKIYPNVWEILNKNKLSTGIYGSLHSSNTNQEIKNYKFYVPDIFSSHSNCHPKSLQPFQDFQLNLSRKSSRNVDKSIGGKKAITTFISLLKNGLTFQTFLKIFNQLLIEKCFNGLLNKRRTLQADINFDIFFKLLKRNNPNFSTFFSNHVASSMHRYWEAAFPNDYKKQIHSQKWIKKYKGEIFYSMKTTEKIIQNLLKYSKKRPNCEIWICTSMGQNPVEGYDAISNQLILEETNKFLNFLDLNPNKYKIKPTMMPRFTFESEKISDIQILEDRIKKLKLNDQNIEQMTCNNSLTIRLMHWNAEPSFTYKNKPVSKEELGMNMIDIQDNSGTSAYHIPEGCLLIYGKNSSRFNNLGTIPTHEIKNLIINSFEES